MRRKKNRRRARRGTRDFSKKALWKSIDKDQKAATRAKLASLRTRIKEAVALRKGSRAGLSEFCALERQRGRQRIEQMRAELKAAIAAVRLEARGSCERARRAPRLEVERLRAELAAERKFLSDMRRIAAGNRARASARPGVSRAVRRSESDDEVRQNIDPELVPLWNRVKGSIKGTPKKSRTEAFLQYVEENPREQFQGYEDKTDALVADLERQMRAGRRDARRRRRRASTRRVAARRRRR